MEPVPERAKRLSESAPVKLLVLALLVFMLLIPLARIGWLVDERARRLAEVGAEVAATWGRAQTVGGPILALPYRYEVPVDPAPDADGGDREARARPKTRTVWGTAYLLPRELRWRGTVEPEVRYRGIFEVVVYTARLSAEGFFDAAGFAGLDLDPEAWQWSEAALLLGLSDPKGLAEGVTLGWEGGARPFAPGTAGAAFLPAGIHAPRVASGPPAPGSRLPFSFEVVLRGTGDLRFLPAGEETFVDLGSAWPSPSFGGAYLPGQREVGAQGFRAAWRVPHLGRNVPQAWLAGQVEAAALEATSFGVGLIVPADGYQKTERSIKYGVLFILLTFVTFFLLELVSPVRLFAMNYLLVGCALCLFYLLLLSLSEHLGFPAAYALGAGACTVLISAYSRSLFGGARWALLLAVCLASLYGYLYVLLQAADYALLLGAVGLFAILALVMYLTRRLDWRSLKFSPAGGPRPRSA